MDKEVLLTMLLNDSNFLQVALHNYDNPQCTSVSEFTEDLRRLTYIQRLFNRYSSSGELRERLILNHIIILFNVFGDLTLDMLFLKINKEYHSILVTFLVYLNRMPDSHNGMRISDFQLDQHIVNTLRGQ